MYEKKENELDGLLASIDKYVKRRSKVHCELIRVWAVDDPHPQEDFIDSLWAQIVKLRQEKWIERQVLTCVRASVCVCVFAFACARLRERVCLRARVCVRACIDMLLWL